jgi:universal stress protein A
VPVENYASSLVHIVYRSEGKTEMSHKNVLVAVDGSNESDQVVSAAKEIAADASITLVTVIQPMAYTFGPEYSGLMTNYANIEQEIEKAAEAKLEALAKEHDLSGERLVTAGAPAYEIRKQAESSGADLIVIGSHGRHGLGLLLGSTANGVLHGAPCNVFVVRIQQ